MKKVIRYRGATYIRVGDSSSYAESELLTYTQVRKSAAVEIGNVFSPRGKEYPGWADLDGNKFAEVTPPVGWQTQAFLPIDNREGWRWVWMEGMSQEDVQHTT